MTWQPIETAPVDTMVQLGKYEDDYKGGLAWRKSVGIAWETHRVFLMKCVRREWCDRNYTHWQPLPPPPGDGE